MSESLKSERPDRFRKEKSLRKPSPQEPAAIQTYALTASGFPSVARRFPSVNELSQLEI